MEFLAKLARFVGRHIPRVPFERVLISILEGFYARRRQIMTESGGTFYFDQSVNFFECGFRSPPPGFGPFYRAFAASEVLHPSDILADLGSGEGFLAARFFAPMCKEVDGFELDPNALAEAKRNHTRPNLRYHQLNFLSQPFVRDRYDVVVLNAAWGNFKKEDLEQLIGRLACIVTPEGLFVGSRAMDVLEQSPWMFQTDSRLVEWLRSGFRYVQFREISYPIVGRMRREILWRCSHSPNRLNAYGWQSHISSS
jgi:hypothetical protein